MAAPQKLIIFGTFSGLILNGALLVLSHVQAEVKLLLVK